ENSVENLRDWISNSGGHLICTRGRPAAEKNLAASFASILPVAWKSDSEKQLRMKLTERGRSLGIFDPLKQGDNSKDPDMILNLLPSLVTATVIERERALAVVLARVQDDNAKEPMAVLSMQTYGAGKTVVMEGQGMWRWAF